MLLLGCLSTCPSKLYVLQDCTAGYHPSILTAPAGTCSLSAHCSSKAGHTRRQEGFTGNLQKPAAFLVAPSCKVVGNQHSFLKTLILKGTHRWGKRNFCKRSNKKSAPGKR